MRIKLKDFELACEHLKSSILSETLEIKENEDQERIEISYTSKDNKEQRVIIYNAVLNSTPEVTTTKRLYKSNA